MKQMKTESARTLTCLAAALVAAGGILMSPSGAMLSLVLAAISAFFPTVFGKGPVRLIAAILLLAALGLSLGRYPAFRHEQTAYREHVMSHSQKESR
jgi:uncharacterized phage infection (PIP) family protein YhgE